MTNSKLDAKAFACSRDHVVDASCVRVLLHLLSGPAQQRPAGRFTPVQVPAEVHSWHMYVAVTLFHLPLTAL